MRKALFLTAYNRLAYLQETLYSWQEVRGLKDWHFVAMIEPSPIQDQVKEEFELFVARAGLTDYQIRINPVKYGVLHHPWVGFEQMLASDNFDFVVRAEDDLVVSTDILEFFSWAAHNFQGSDNIATVNAFSLDSGSECAVQLSQSFSPLVWGTWANRWKGVIGPTWDHDYSTYNGWPGNQAGWDWNLNTRVFPELDLFSISPLESRVDNIGVIGTHGTAANFLQSPSFKAERDPQFFHLV